MASLTAQATNTSVPPLINYQGELADVNGNPLTGTKKLTFNIYDAANGGNVVWGPQVFDKVPLINGRFNVILGSTDRDGKLITEAFGAKERYLGITVEDNPEIAPRQQILSAPFAVKTDHAARAEHASKADVAEIVQGILCHKKGSLDAEPGFFRNKFSASECGGVIPDESYTGVAKSVHTGCPIASFTVHDAPEPAISFWSDVGSCDYNVKALYIKINRVTK